MENNEIKDVVRNKYGQLARQGGSCCSSPSADQFEQIRSYQPEQLASIPAGANLSLGCGNPTALAPIEEGMTVVDLGSGAGIDVFLAARCVGPRGRVIGIDMTGEMIERARENARQAKLENVDFRLGDIEALPVGDSSVDLILSNCVINLAPDKGKVFSEAFRVLRSGGRLQISDIVTRGHASAALRRDAELWAGCVSGAIERDEYLALLRRVGFDPIEVVAEHEYDAFRSDSFAIVSISLIARKA